MPDKDDVNQLADGTDEQADQGMAGDASEKVDDEIDSLVEKSTDATDDVKP